MGWREREVEGSKAGMTKRARDKKEERAVPYIRRVAEVVMRASDRLMWDELKLGPGWARRSRRHVVGWQGEKGGLPE